jgi:DNA ligase D-like protein (predicted 3'-phosphoesterase)
MQRQVGEGKEMPQKGSDKLREYRDKRDFRRTSEPDDERRPYEYEPFFVVQKHDASSLHYDLRLEVDGVLKSWAVPKGPSTDTSVKRLALPTEDHPIAYGDFEGVIPEGEYGAGVVLVWDRGPYRNMRAEKEEPQSMQESLDAGQVEVWLEGEKIRGGYALVRTGSGDDERWLLIKMDDDEADARRNPTSTEPDSVLTGRSLEEVRADAEGSQS